MKLQTDAPKRFFRWWGSELMRMLPSSWREYICSKHGRVLRIVVDPDDLRVSCRERGLSRELDVVSVQAGEKMPAAAAAHLRELAADINPESTQLEITVNRDLALVKDIDLPAAARENLRQTLAFEMHRLTPFSVDEVYFDYTVSESHAGVFRVCLAVVPRKIVAQAVDWLRGWEPRQCERSARLLPPELTDENGAVRMAFRDATWRRLRVGRAATALLALNALLIIAVVSVPLVQARLQLDRIETRLDETFNVVKTASAASREVDRFRGMAEFLSKRIHTRVSAVELLEELTERLPDTTWVSRLELRGGTVYLQGSSSEAAALIEVLQGSGMLTNPRFDSPVVREGATGRDFFHIVARVAASGGGV